MGVTGTRIMHDTYGAGTVLRPEGDHKLVVKFDREDGFHGSRPLIIWAYQVA